MATISRSGISTAQPIQATHITNIIDALDGTSTTVTVVATGSFSGSFNGTIAATGSFTGSLIGNLIGSASWATNVTSIPFTSITSLPASLTGFNGDGVSEIKNKITGDINVSALTNGGFYPVQTSGTITITLGSRAYNGFEVTFFYWVDGGGFDVQFAAGGQTIVSANGNLKMNGTGSAVVAKYIDTNTWALIGNLKA
jgi:hypothetical protein